MKIIIRYLWNGLLSVASFYFSYCLFLAQDIPSKYRDSDGSIVGQIMANIIGSCLAAGGFYYLFRAFEFFFQDTIDLHNAYENKRRNKPSMQYKDIIHENSIMTKKEMLKKCGEMERYFKTIIIGISICFILVLYFIWTEQKANDKGHFFQIAVFIIIFITIFTVIANAAWPLSYGIFCKKCRQGPTVLKCRDFVEAKVCPKCGEPL